MMRSVFISMDWLKFTAVFSVLSCIGLLYSNCNDKEKEGEALAKKYCVSCHVYPEPSLLPKTIWSDHVLPVMAAFANYYKDKDGNYKSMPPGLRDPIIKNVRASIPIEDWKKIVEYYTSHAPDSLSMPGSNVEINRLNLDVKQAEKKSKSFTTCVFFDEKSKLLFQSNMSDNLLNVFDPQLKLLTTINSCKGVVDIQPMGDDKEGSQYLLTHIGSFQPSKEKEGFIERIEIKNNKVVKRIKLCDSLYRPVQSKIADVDNDGENDIVVCEFGFMSGELSLFKNLGNNKYKKTILSSIAGAEKLYVDDINKDGLPDLWVLFAHSIEGIFQFINKGNGQFEQKQVLSFPPSYGSSYFNLADMDNDGKKEIIYTCGDNADYSQVMKPYHGVYIFKNTGTEYKQVYFKHLNGCYKAMPLDINNDRMPDLAVISFFADFEKNPNEAFVILQNEGTNKFKAFTDTAIVNKGRWICMDIKNVNEDGRPDIILGNLAAKPANNEHLMMQWMNGPEFIVLQSK